MSHAATNWAIQQRGLKPTTKIVLWHLCDRFNPDYGCFPSQERLAHDCEISRSTLNAHLGQLEAAGLLRRVPRLNPVTKRQMPTRYILGFEPGFAPDHATPCPETGHGDITAENPFAGAEDLAEEAPAAPEPCLNSGHGNGAGPVSEFQADPCPENALTRVRNPDTNPVREPLREPVKEEEGAPARDADFDWFFAELLGALGLDHEGALPAWWQGWPARTHVRRWSDELGLCGDRIIEVARDTRRERSRSTRWAEGAGSRHAARRPARCAGTQTGDSGRNPKRSRKRDTGPRPSDDELAAFYADLVNSEQFLPPSMISNAMCDAMLTRGLVTADRLRQRGVL